MQQEPVTIGTEHKRDIHHLRIGKCLLHPGTDTVIIVLCLDDSNRNIGFIVEDIVGPSRFGPAHGVALDEHPTIGNIHLFPDLVMMVPARRQLLRE